MTQKTAMAARYTEITLEEMEKFLKRGFRALRPREGIKNGEIIFDLTLGGHVGIRVWSSISPRSGTGAGVGSDAIRVQLISLKDKGPLERGKAPIVKRTQGWKNKLQDRIEELAEKYENREDFWEEWAETRQRKGDPERQMREDDAREKREERERAEESHGAQPTYQREVPLDKLKGESTPKQINFIRVLLRDLKGHQEWSDLGLDVLTGFSHIPNQKQLVTLSKQQASQVISTLRGAGYGYGNRRFADSELAE